MDSKYEESRKETLKEDIEDKLLKGFKDIYHTISDKEDYWFCGHCGYYWKKRIAS